MMEWIDDTSRLNASWVRVRDRDKVRVRVRVRVRVIHKTYRLTLSVPGRGLCLTRVCMVCV